MPSMRPVGGANVSLTIESDPPGADAKTSLGPSCRTPCMIPVPADREFTVNYSLHGYQPQAMAVRPRAGGDAARNRGRQRAASADVTPNPVYAQLQPAPPPRADAEGPRAAAAAATEQSRPATASRMRLTPLGGAPKQRHR